MAVTAAYSAPHELAMLAVDLPADFPPAVLARRRGAVSVAHGSTEHSALLAQLGLALPAHPASSVGADLADPPCLSAIVPAAYRAPMASRTPSRPSSPAPLLLATKKLAADYHSRPSSPVQLMADLALQPPPASPTRRAAALHHRASFASLRRGSMDACSAAACTSPRLASADAWSNPAPAIV
ncbi:hypothetical protein AMAG_02965 [Allomyces macrogynus ATCC 38327]|uniref:Uncharacterized protein n=1 Tax=Allomyces macrogynus (strain ATCC 38327) TaxID=578462 RepID=A0A0L0S466_ALLM3|nr:hypothetical protein AMAG_02965 [Allomyces macrogynus ATCC 38327]|eukprot:KNE57230.1 hypothetical protein AMAG_02965 [Allomyces macrogynus ATCC 38327]